VTKDFELLSSRPAFQGRVLQVRVDRVRLGNGQVAELEVVRHPGAVAVVALTPGNEVLLLRQFRYATGEWVLEVPAGKLDGGEEPLAGARRELEEETGFAAAALEPLGWVWTTPGFTNEKIWLFLAHDLRATRQALQADEVLTVESVPLGEAIERALSGRIQDAKSVCCLLRAAARLGRLAVA
jgi:ADP-ribose pyrophosphatase